MLGHSSITVEESFRYFAEVADFADFAKKFNKEEQERLQRNASNASRILEDSALDLVANWLYNPPVTFLDDCRM